MENAKKFGWAGAAAGAAIFNIIKDKGPISRVEIVGQTGLSKSTVSQHVNKLIEMTLVSEELAQINGVGRRRRLLELNKNVGYVIGIDLDAKSLKIAICNMNAEIIDSDFVEISVSSAPEKILEKIEEMIDALLVRNTISIEELVSAGMGFPGPVEFSTGLPISPPIMPGWHQYPIRSKLENIYNCPVYVDNDVNMMALGEMHSGFGQDVDNFIFIKVGTGIGAGIIFDGQLYRGSQGCAGDIGHIAIDGDETLCPCGNKGCLEVVSAGPAIERKALAFADENKNSLLARIKEEKGTITPLDVGLLANNGDLVSQKIIRASGKAIGTVLAKVTNLYNPRVIVIGGEIARIGDMFLSSIKEKIYQRSLPLATRELKIRKSMINEEVGLIGAAITSINEVYSHDNVTRMVMNQEK